MTQRVKVAEGNTVPKRGDEKECVRERDKVADDGVTHGGMIREGKQWRENEDYRDYIGSAKP